MAKKKETTNTKDMANKSEKEIMVEVAKAQRDIAEKYIEFKIGKLKDIRVIKAAKKEIARMLTIVNSNKDTNAK